MLYILPSPYIHKQHTRVRSSSQTPPRCPMRFTPSSPIHRRLPKTLLPLLPFSLPPQTLTLTEPILIRAGTASGISTAIDYRRPDDAWSLDERSLPVDAPPRRPLLRKLLVALTETSNLRRLDRAFHAVESLVQRERESSIRHQHHHHDEMFHDDSFLLYLPLALARRGANIPASALLRRLLEMGERPRVALWTAVAAHIARETTNPAGASLAAELVVVFGRFFGDEGVVDPRKEIDSSLLAMRPDPLAFEFALTGCLASGLARKAEELLDLMPRMGVEPNADLLVTMAYVYEGNGRLDEMKKLARRVIDNPDVDVSSRFREFYECLLSCYLKLNDLESASGIVLDMLGKAREARSSLAVARAVPGAAESWITGAVKSCWIASDPLSFEEFCRDKNENFRRLAGETQELVLHLRRKLQSRVELVKSDHGILQPTDKLYARLVRAFLKAGKTAELARFLIKVGEEEGPMSVENSLVVQAINACISLGMLDQAHDLLDEMRFNRVRVGSSIYLDLLKAYCKENKIGEVTALLKDARKAGVQLDSSCLKASIQSRAQWDVDGALRLVNKMKGSGISRGNRCEFENLVKGCRGNAVGGTKVRLLEEIKDVKGGVDYRVLEWNSVIHFFCKKGLMDDAQKALRKIRELGHLPNSQTFHSLVSAYTAIGGKCVEVAELWGEMKVLVRMSQLELDQELLDSLLYCFVRGGLFLRANEVVNILEEEGMFIDKYKYRALWLKYHRMLYKGMPPKIQTEAQVERREAALVFKRWLNLT